MTLTPDRKQKYQHLEQRIGKTQLVPYVGEVHGGSTIHIKRECDQPFGSHYDRVYLDLFKHYEEQGKIKPGKSVLETTSGSAGVSFAGIGHELGYPCYVMLPAAPDLSARRKAIEEQGAKIVSTPADEYISGFTKDRIIGACKEYGAFFLNHSMGKGGTSNETTLKALEGIAEEILDEMQADYFIPAIGNGSSALGPGRIFKQRSPSTKIVGYETFQSAVTYDQKYPGLYGQKFGIKPGTLPRHGLPGTSYQGIDFPHIKQAVKGGVLDDVVLVSDVKTDEAYRAITSRQDTLALPHWDDPAIVNHDDLGRTTKAGLAVALKLAKDVKDKKLVVVGYDKADRY